MATGTDPFRGILDEYFSRTEGAPRKNGFDHIATIEREKTHAVGRGFQIAQRHAAKLVREAGQPELADRIMKMRLERK
jgi:hypothetical protein